MAPSIQQITGLSSKRSQAVDWDMPRIRFAKGRPEIVVPEGANLMRALLDSGIPVASSCNGDGVCAKCRIRIAQGADHLSKETDLEATLRERHEIPKETRISCQTHVLGDITVDASYW
jgi:2Fe-2S ferredoxin